MKETQLWLPKGVSLTAEEAYRIYSDRLYIVKYSKIYSMHYSEAWAAFYTMQIYQALYKGQHFTKRGKWQVMTAKEVNQLIGHKLLNE